MVWPVLRFTARFVVRTKGMSFQMVQSPQVYAIALTLHRSISRRLLRPRQLLSWLKLGMSSDPLAALSMHRIKKDFVRHWFRHQYGQFYFIKLGACSLCAPAPLRENRSGIGFFLDWLECHSTQRSFGKLTELTELSRAEARRCRAFCNGLVLVDRHLREKTVGEVVPPVSRKQFDRPQHALMPYPRVDDAPKKDALDEAPLNESRDCINQLNLWLHLQHYLPLLQQHRLPCLHHFFRHSLWRT